MIYKIVVFSKKEESCLEIINEIKDLGIKKDFSVFFKKIYFLEGDLKEEETRLISSLILIDPVKESYFLEKGFFSKELSQDEILITYQPGVTDIEALCLEKAAKDLGFRIKAISGRLFKFSGLNREEIDYLAPKILYNPLIEQVLDYQNSKNILNLDYFAGKDYEFQLKEIDLLEAKDRDLEEISKKGHFSLSLEEMKIIQDYFKRQDRNPTDCELETIAILWSEHCAHKTFRGIIEYQEKDRQGNLIEKEKIDNLLKSTIMEATYRISHPGCVSVFEDNSGIVKFDENFNLCFKVETHNHPSSLEPYGGSSTGIGGVIRDILGTGRGARPFASIDVFCFSPWNISYEDLPKGVLHPKRIIKGVIKGVRDYGNRMGIPTVAGALFFDERFLGNPLVYCGTLGLIKKDNSFKEVKKSYLIILCGAKTGRDGIHGATFSSQELDEITSNLRSAVQIGNPIEEKKLTEAILRATYQNLISTLTDCGAGGICCAITELAKNWGAEVYLERVPLKYKGLSYTEIWISESQERMVLSVEEKNLEKLKRIFEEEEVEFTIIGKVTDTKKILVFYQGKCVCELDLDFLFHLPKLEKRAVWIRKKEEKIRLEEKDNYNEDLKKLLSSPNISCKDWILREYDHEVQAGSVVKSIYGIKEPLVCDAAVVRPDLKSEKYVVIGIGINPFYSDFDPYIMASLVLEEALRNVSCCGASLEKTFILDNFSWGSPEDESNLAGLVRASLGCKDFSLYYQVPFISGKDSLYNEYVVQNKRIVIPGTLLISAVSILDNPDYIPCSVFLKEGNLIYLIGLTKSELGYSEYFRMLKIKKGFLPKIEKKFAK
ncbi:MAG TPA: phosphoribosylformylglycinamidine synthase, partial [Candidatus Omnitrophica bacterium]|nr:phosphoribosylformylglycinamidine synthase [Candidatus Omnitrophota bacterium]